MIEARATTERIDLAGADDPRDVVHRAVACLARGGVVALPTDSGYGLAAGALHPEAVARARRARGLADSELIALAVRGPEELADWAPGATEQARRIARRAWPGPVTIVAEGAISRGLAARLPAGVRSAVATDSAIGLRSPGHDAFRELMGLVPGPVALTGAHRRGAPGGPLTTADAVAALGGEVDMIVDDGPILAAGRDTVLGLAGDAWTIRRPGVVDEATIRRMAGTLILFVCTGNTCRSPMAEALCKDLLAARHRCAPGDLEDRGLFVLSAGLAAGRGQRAAAEAVRTIRDRGGSLRDHASRPVTPELVAFADWLVAMTAGHRDALLDLHPEAAARVRLADPLGDDVDDPIGCDLDVYRETAEALEAHIRDLLDELGL